MSEKCIHCNWLTEKWVTFAAIITDARNDKERTETTDQAVEGDDARGCARGGGKHGI